MSASTHLVGVPDFAQTFVTVILNQGCPIGRVTAAQDEPWVEEYFEQPAG